MKPQIPSKKEIKRLHKSSKPNDPPQIEHENLAQNLLNNVRMDETIQMENRSANLIDDSIIDISGQNQKLAPVEPQKSKVNAPYWPHQYVYSYSEILNASPEQKSFYGQFKQKFLNSEYLDLQGNTNYAFILLFDLLNDYENHQDIQRLEDQLTLLGQHYRKTESYAVSFLIKKMQEIGDFQGEARVRAASINVGYISDDYWKLGSRYKGQLKLNNDEVKLLDKLCYPNNNFTNLEFCRIEIIKLFLKVIQELKAKYIQEGSTLEAEFSNLADLVAKKQHHYKKGTQNYNYQIESSDRDFHSYIFKHCENAVREYYGHKRKISIETFFTDMDVKSEFQIKIASRVTEVLPGLINTVSLPDETTDMELYTQNTSRWKHKFENFTENFTTSAKFYEEILELGRLNKRNPSIENIFFEASKFIAKQDKELALAFYIHYLFHDLKSATFDNKQLTKTIQKSLFKTNEHLHQFEAVVSGLIKDKNLESALKAVSEVYKVKRKKIQLDTASIKEVQQQHSGTVELLNEYLQDDYEDENNSIKTLEVSKEEIVIEITHKTQEIHQSIYKNELRFSEIHEAALELFAKSSFTVSEDEIQEFTKSKGVFKDQLIDSINEACYESLDDLLIEQDDEYYVINEQYYKSILTHVE